MMKSVKNCVELIVILIVLGAATYSQRAVLGDWVRERMKPELPPSVEFEEIVREKEVTPPVILSPAQPEETVSDKEKEMAVSPDSFNLAVPFTPQAPHANWDEPYKESCEEASLYMVQAYYQKMSAGLIDAETADAELLKMIDFEKELFGFYEDTTAQQTGTLAEMFYGYETVETIENPTVEQIKEFVVAGHPVMVPVAGRELKNPFFTAPGPIYHMLVIRGFTQDGRFITNDPGTKNGEAYLYDFDTVMNAMHDWNAGGEIKEGKKVILIAYPN